MGEKSEESATEVVRSWQSATTASEVVYGNRDDDRPTVYT